MLEVTTTLLRRICGCPSEINKVFAPSAMIIKRELQFCQEKMPSATMIKANSTAEMRFARDLLS